MATSKKSDDDKQAEPTAAPAASKSAEGDKQAKAARDGYLDARKKAAQARLQAAGLASEPKVEGETIEVRTAPGPGDKPRPMECGGALMFTPEPRKVALRTITYRQYHSIVSNPLLEVKGAAPKDFEGWAKG